jgi:hypothetical protein
MQFGFSHKTLSDINAQPEPCQVQRILSSVSYIIRHLTSLAKEQNGDICLPFA